MYSVYHQLLRQIPAHIRDQYPIFCKFIEYYYRWLQTRGFTSLEAATNIDTEYCAISIKKQQDQDVDLKQFLHFTIANQKRAAAEVIGIDNNRLLIRYLTLDAKFEIGDLIHIRLNSKDQYTEQQQQLLKYFTISSVDTIPSVYIDHFISLLDANHIFKNDNNNIAVILRYVKQLYQAKGSEKALKYLLKVTRNVNADVKYPWENVLRVSDGLWNKTYSITIAVNPLYWNFIPINFNSIRIMDDVPDESGIRHYVDHPITKVEIFGQQSENYDERDKNCDNGWWKKLESTKQFNELVNHISDHGDPIRSSNLGCTYGVWSNRFVTPFIKVYFTHDPQVKLNQEIRIIGQDASGNDIVIFSGNITRGIDRISVDYGGEGWQIGQVFSVNKNNIWYNNRKFDRLGTDKTRGSLNIINDWDIPIEYAINKPLIGRVTSVGQNGEVVSAELLQCGEHIPEGGAKLIKVCPALSHQSIDVNHDNNDAVLSVEYDIIHEDIGQYVNNGGMISDNDIRIQDSNYYQQFSYDIVSNADPITYIDMAKLMHPAGTKMFTTYALEGNLDAESTFDIYVSDPSVSITIYDIAAITEFLVKEFHKIINEKVKTHEHVQLTNVKFASDTTYIDDGYPSIIYSVIIGYDQGVYDLGLNTDNPTEYSIKTKEEYKQLENIDLKKWSQRVIDKGVNTGYCDVGSITKLHINYKTHEFDQYPKVPEKKLGGKIVINTSTEILIDSFVDRFYKCGDHVLIKFSLQDKIHQNFKSISVKDNQGNIEHTLQEYAGQYTLKFDARQSDIIIDIVGFSQTHNIIKQISSGGLVIISSKFDDKGIPGENIKISAYANPGKTISQFYYKSTSTGIVHLNKSAINDVIMPNEDITFVCNFVDMSCLYNINDDFGGSSYIQNFQHTNKLPIGTLVNVVIMPDNYHEFDGITIINDVTKQSTTIYNNTFEVPDYPITILVKYRKKRSTVIVNDSSIGNSGGFTKIYPSINHNIGDVITIDYYPKANNKLISSTVMYNGKTKPLYVENNRSLLQLESSDVNIEVQYQRLGGYFYIDVPFGQLYIVSDYKDGDFVQKGKDITVNIKRFNDKVATQATIEYDSNDEIITQTINIINNCFTLTMDCDDITITNIEFENI